MATEIKRLFIKIKPRRRLIPKIRFLGWIPYDYINLYNLTPAKIDKEHEVKLKKVLYRKSYVICGDNYLSSHICVPVFNDGPLVYSQRAWSKIMKACVTPNEDDIDLTTDRDFFEEKNCHLKIKLPKKVNKRVMKYILKNFQLKD